MWWQYQWKTAASLCDTTIEIISVKSYSLLDLAERKSQLPNTYEHNSLIIGCITVSFTVLYHK